MFKRADYLKMTQVLHKKAKPVSFYFSENNYFSEAVSK